MIREHLFNRKELHPHPLKDRMNKLDIRRSQIDPYAPVEHIDRHLQKRISLIADEIRGAHKNGASVICAFGAHTIKNGLGGVLAAFAERGWFTHLASNGASVIHDWEFAYQGESSEDVRTNVQEGKFGTWNETGLYINLALAVGAYEGLGYGESVGAMISYDGLEIPEREDLKEIIYGTGEESGLPLWKKAAAADLLEVLETLEIPSGFLHIKHTAPDTSVQATAYSRGVPFTSHPMIGHDIIYTHPANRGAVIGRTADRDFLSYVNSVQGLEGGVYLSVGSAVMSPMIFEKSLSMVRNAGIPHGRKLRDCGIHVVDLQEETWDWNKGEPPSDNPAYYLRFMKTFSRMGCRKDYTCADNRIFFTGLFQELLRREE